MTAYTIGKMTPYNTEKVKNASFRRGTLETVCPPSKIGELALADAGTGSVIKAKCSASGVDVFRVGRALYAKNASDVISRVANNYFYTNSNTVMFHDDGAFIMTDNTRMLSVTDALATTAASPYIPTVLKFTSATSMIGTECEKPNALSDNVKFEYSIPDDTSIIYLPRNFKFASVVSVKYKNGSSYSGTCNLVTQSMTTTLGFTPAISGNFVVTLKLGSSTDASVLSLNSFSTVRNALYSATAISVLYPGIAGMNKTLLLGAGQTLYALGMKDGLYVTTDAIVSVSVGERVTAMANYTDGALVFTPSCVKYVHIEGSGLSDSVIEQKIVKRDLGCDMPMSVVVCDDKIFFANSDCGIYYIDKFGLTERDGSCHVSTLIDGELLSNGKSALQGAVAVASGTSYYLSVGGTVYVWNYAAAHPSSPDVDEEKKYGYVFTRLDTVNAGDFIGARGGRVCMIEKTTGYVYRFDENAAAASTAEIGTEIETYPLDLGTPHEKVMTRLLISAELASGATVRVYFDGVESKSTYTLTRPELGGVCSFIIKPERHKFRSIKLKITATRPLTLCGAEATFSKTGI